MSKRPATETSDPALTSKRPKPPSGVTMSLERIRLEHIPESYRVYGALFRDVSNASFLQAQLISRNPEFEYAFVDASTVLSRAHLLAAVWNAVYTSVEGNLRTPNVHSEVVASLNINNNIADGYRRWGITPDKTKDLVVVKILSSPDTLGDAQQEKDVWTRLTAQVKGRPVQLTDQEIAQVTDWQKVRKYYKMNGAPVLDQTKDEAEKRKKMESLAIMGMALRGL
ncbi:kinase binding protein CGI-121-domain-containing protein [Triangularia verruculosa]|uniref:EKC/KEOPS complex subunit CGI121 n=1 Tax=Triangularia verruculosa TaxID=2587418 RepID=A0AAN6XM62_9PEZI|nr:kinase binding protein CGI-121-domain-containing protein [Triangularia verruculosa]